MSLLFKNIIKLEQKYKKYGLKIIVINKQLSIIAKFRVHLNEKSYIRFIIFSILEDLTLNMMVKYWLEKSKYWNILFNENYIIELTCLLWLTDDSYILLLKENFYQLVMDIKTKPILDLRLKKSSIRKKVYEIDSNLQANLTPTELLNDIEIRNTQIEFIFSITYKTN